MNKKNKSLLVNVFVCFVALVILIGSLSLYRYFKKQHEQELTNFQASQQEKKKNSVENTDYIPRLKTVLDQKNLNYNQIDQYLKNVQFNGSIAVFENGKLKMNKGYGFQDLENGKPNNPNTLYLIGSAQKFLTGMMVKKLELDDKININDDVDRYLSHFETTPKITLKDLMLHRSGLYKYKGSKDILNLDEAVDSIQKRGVDPKHYHKHFYNDANYLVLAKVIEEVTHHTYAENYYKYFGNPFQLKHSAFYNDVRYKEDMAKGYQLNKNAPVFKPPMFLNQYYGAGNLYMSVHDMGVLVRKLQMNKVFPSKDTKPYLHELMTTRYPEKYRYGFYTYPDHNRINGIFYGQTFTTYFNDHYIVVLATNYENPKPNVNEAKIKHIYYNILKQHKVTNHPGLTVAATND